MTAITCYHIIDDPAIYYPFHLSVEIVDGNVKMTLGMIWTIILRFAIQDISVEGKNILYTANVAFNFLCQIELIPGIQID